MKKLSILLCLAVTACTTQNANHQSLEKSYEPTRLQLMSDLDDPKYSALQISEDESNRAVCASQKTLSCLQINQETCHKIYRKELSNCIEKKQQEGNGSFNADSPFAKGYLQGCAAGGALKYGANGIPSSIECIRQR